MNPTWSNFQSLIQLSIALNAAFAAFGTYAGSSLTSEENKLAAMFLEIKEGRATLPHAANEDLGGKNEVKVLLGRCQSIVQDYDDFVKGRFRLICVAFSAIAIPVLAYSSYYPIHTIKYYIDVLIIGLFYPFYWGIWRVIWFHKRVITEVRGKRLYIQGRMEFI